MGPKALLLCTVACALAAPLNAEETRELDAHVHGNGALNIAIEGNEVAIELEVPGFDIVGFEYAAESEEDIAAVEAALKTLGMPANVFALPNAAGCKLVEATVELHGDGTHDEYHHEGEDHADGHDEHGHDDHADTEASHGHEDHNHEEHVGDPSHSEFHAEYLMTCAGITELTTIALPYFRAFPNAEELEVQLVTDNGAVQMEATPEQAVLDLSPAM